MNVPPEATGPELSQRWNFARQTHASRGCTFHPGFHVEPYPRTVQQPTNCIENRLSEKPKTAGSAYVSYRSGLDTVHSDNAV